MKNIYIFFIGYISYQEIKKTHKGGRVSRDYKGAAQGRRRLAPRRGRAIRQQANMRDRAPYLMFRTSPSQKHRSIKQKRPTKEDGCELQK
ncbi:hypothetical protein A2765_00730 [Candidatus Kaiserbacteria bacterium RIFCSPHIGHO2_01_FULL_56_24]|uniref:Uncharacterized protein n=1 Tax=Candidatus Kaiserbacteria bacterium RIFCSPHIGHO2_01_FULL_56_24 TaxID=1798487 RepID=A0A1F6DC27_9BACT|nr:MAG: hypothetical protein A2765_00730 [Candidatus Kaiserbacteria bacterium RIFCSPHIGHO2_01_FULL_56_24]